MLRRLFLPIFILILIGYATTETLKISRVVKNEITRQIVDSSSTSNLFLK